MKKSLSLSFTLLLTSFLFGQSFQSAITKTLKIHEDSETAKEQLKGLEAMETLTKTYPKEWLPNFWAAYQCTQMAMLKNRAKDYPEHLEPNELLNRSENYLTQAVQLSEGEATDALKSDFHALRSLIYGFRQTYSKDSLSYIKFKEMEQQEQQAALALAPENPIMKVFTATSIGRAKDASTFELVASVALLKQAKAAFEAYPVRAMTTHFNQEWIPFWLPWLEKRLHQQLNIAAEKEQ